MESNVPSVDDEVVDDQGMQIFVIKVENVISVEPDMDPEDELSRDTLQILQALVPSSLENPSAVLKITNPNFVDHSVSQLASGGFSESQFSLQADPFNSTSRTVPSETVVSILPVKNEPDIERITNEKSSPNSRMGKETKIHDKHHTQNIDKSSFHHECVDCGKKFKKSSQLTRHYRIHTGERPFKCEICEKAFNQKGALQIHLAMHSGQRPHQCDFCQATFSQRGNLRAHMRRAHSIHDIEVYKCEKCACVFRKVGSLNAHVQHSHSNSPKAYNTVVKQNPNDVEVSGKTLTASFTESRTNIIKTKNHLQVKSKHRHQCCFCGNGFKKPSDLLRHYRVHTGERPFSCELCGKQFSVKASLNNHLKIHTGAKDFHCHVCNSMFSSKGSLKIHIRIHTGERPYKCPHCDQTFRTAGHRKSHRTTHHKDDGHNIKSARRQRQTGNHYQVGLRQCEFCGKSFKRPSELLQHYRVHTGERPFSCELCGKQFAVKSSLDGHYKIHTRAKDFHCRVCNSVFSSKSSLKVHMRLHTGERPYECSFCNRGFRTVGHRQSHMAACHKGNEQTIKCVKLQNGKRQQSQKQRQASGNKST